MTEEQKDHLTLKWETLKSWSFNSNLELLKEYSELGYSMGAIMRQNRPRQKEILCELIDESNLWKVTPKK